MASFGTYLGKSESNAKVCRKCIHFLTRQNKFHLRYEGETDEAPI
jgi:hypothetical protein